MRKEILYSIEYRKSFPWMGEIMQISELPTVGKMPLSEKVYRILVQSIVSGELPPGTKLQEKHIAKQMEVSATPVREAFKKLVGDGFIEIVPYCGAVVKELDEEEIREAYHCREALEKMALEDAIDRFDESTLKQLFDIIEKGKNTEDILEVSKINKSFHNVIYLTADNTMLCRLLDMLNTVISRDMKYSASDEKRRNEIYHEHVAIAEAIRDRDLARAQNAMVTHIRNGQKYIEGRRPVYGESGSQEQEK